MANRPGPIIQGHTADPGTTDYPESVAPMGTSGSDGPLIMRNVFAKFNFVSGSNGPEQPPFSFYVPGPRSIRFRNKVQVVVRGSEIKQIIDD